MNRFIREYDGRKLVLKDEVHEVLGKVNGIAAYRLRAPDGTEHEIPEADFRTFVAQGFVSDASDGHPEQDRLISDERKRELRFRSETVREVIQMRDQGISWSVVHDKLQLRYSTNKRHGWRRKSFPDRANSSDLAEALAAGR